MQALIVLLFVFQNFICPIPKCEIYAKPAEKICQSRQVLYFCFDHIEQGKSLKWWDFITVIKNYFA